MPDNFRAHYNFIKWTIVCTQRYTLVRFAIFYTKMRIAIPIICAISIRFHEIQLEIWTCENSKPTIFFSSERKSELSLLIQLNARTQHIRSLACSFSIDFRFSRIPQFNDRKFHFVQPREICVSLIGQFLLFIAPALLFR